MNWCLSNYTLLLVNSFLFLLILACAPSYNVSNYPVYDERNTQVNEQQNSTSQNLARQVSYMTEENFLKHCTFFFWYKNQEKRDAGFV